MKNVASNRMTLFPARAAGKDRNGAYLIENSHSRTGGNLITGANQLIPDPRLRGEDSLS